MQEARMFETITTALLTSGALTAAALWLTRTWLSERLKQSISHEYGQLLERYKSELAADNEAKIERAKAAYVQERAVRAVGEDFLREAAKVAHAKRIEAIQSLWSELLQITAATPTAVVLSDFLSPDELREAPSKPKTQANFATLTDANLASVLRNAVVAGEARLLAGEHLYALFNAYRSVIGRAVHLSMVAGEKGVLSLWYEDPSVLAQMGRTFSPAEMSTFGVTPSPAPSRSRARTCSPPARA
jgi:hypothetical protein